MNYELMNRLKKDIRAAGEAGMFDLGQIYHPCGTPSCVAGHAFLYATPKEGFYLTGNTTPSGYAIRYMADKFGMTFEESSNIFWGTFGARKGWSKEAMAVVILDITAEEVIAELNRLIKKYRARDRRAVNKVYRDLMRGIKQKPKQKEMV